MKKLFVLGLAAALLGAVAMGCGGSEEEAAEPTDETMTAGGDTTGGDMGGDDMGGGDMGGDTGDTGGEGGDEGGEGGGEF